VLATRVTKAEDYASRRRGLLGRDSMDPAEGLWIVPCPMIHTFFMRFSIDALFLSRRLEVMRVIEGMRPWRLSPWVWGAQSVLELRGGTLRGSAAAGDVIEFR